MIHDSKLLSSFPVSGIFSFPKYLRYTQVEVTLKKFNPRLERLGATNFFHPYFFGNHWFTLNRWIAHATFMIFGSIYFLSCAQVYVSQHDPF